MFSIFQPHLVFIFGRLTIVGNCQHIFFAYNSSDYTVLTKTVFVVANFFACVIVVVGFVFALVIALFWLLLFFHAYGML